MKSVPDSPVLAAASEIVTGNNGVGLAEAINQAGQAVEITDRHGTVLYVNSAFTRITGYSPHEILGQNSRLLKSGKHDSSYYRDLWETVGAGRNWHGELVNRRKDGSLYVEEMTVAPVRDSAGNIFRYVALKQDVTKRRELEDAQRLLAAIVSSSDAAIIGKTPNGTISSWNEGAQELYGYRADEAVGKSISILLPPESPDELPAILACIREGQRISDFETVRLAKDGRRIDVSLSVSPIKDAAGEIVGAATMARDIGERRRADQAIRDSAERFQALFKRSRDGLYILDFEGNFLDVNPAALKLLGYERKEVVSRHISSLLSPDQMPAALRALSELQKTGSPKGPIQLKVKCKSGKLADIEIVSVVIPYKGATGAILGVARDITGRLQAAVLP